MKNRIGKIQYMQEYEAQEWFAAVWACAQIVPTRVEYDGAFGIYEVTGRSPLFDEVREGEEIPEYVISLRQDHNGSGPQFTGIQRLTAGVANPWEFGNA